MKVEFLEPLHNEYIHGSINTPYPKGMGFQVDDPVAGTLKLCTGQAGFQLQRDMVSAADWNAEQISRSVGLGSYFEPPYLVSGTVACRRVTRMEIEGSDVLLTSGTGSLSGTTAVDTALGYFAGKLRVAQSGNETAFILRAQLTPEDSANFRLLVERP